MEGGILAHSEGEETQIAMIESLTSLATLARETSVTLGNTLTVSSAHLYLLGAWDPTICGQQKLKTLDVG